MAVQGRVTNRKKCLGMEPLPSSRRERACQTKSAHTTRRIFSSTLFVLVALPQPIYRTRTTREREKTNTPVVQHHHEHRIGSPVAREFLMPEIVVAIQASIRTKVKTNTVCANCPTRYLPLPYQLALKTAILHILPCTPHTAKSLDCSSEHPQHCSRSRITMQVPKLHAHACVHG